MSSVNRRRLLSRELSSSSSSVGTTTRLAEVVGGTAAECAAICCCCPCVMLAVACCVLYKLPAGILRRAMKRRRLRRMLKRGMLSQQPTSAVLKRRCTCGCDEVELRIKHEKKNNRKGEFDPDEVVRPVEYEGNEKDVMMKELENEMWSRFYTTGFGRSLSQRGREIEIG